SQYPCEAFAERPCPKVFRSDNKRPIGFDVAKALVQLNDCHAIGESFSAIELGRDDDLVALIDIAPLFSKLGRLQRCVLNRLVSFTPRWGGGGGGIGTLIHEGEQTCPIPASGYSGYSSRIVASSKTVEHRPHRCSQDVPGVQCFVMPPSILSRKCTGAARLL